MRARQGAGSAAHEHDVRQTHPWAFCPGGILLVILTAVLMLTSSFHFLAAPGVASSASAADDAPPSQMPEPVTVLADGWGQGDWDWRSMADDEGYVRVIVTYSEQSDDLRKASETAPSKAGLLSKMESRNLREFSSALNGFSGRMTPDDIAELLASPEAGYQIHPDLTVTAMLSESVYQVGADQLWSMRDPGGVYVTGTGMVVAVIDTGVDYTHPDLGGGIGPSYKVIGGYDFVNKDPDPMDDNGHGTHVAGIVAANGGVKGVAPGASILAYKVLDASGQGYMSDVIAAIERAMDPNQDKDTSDHADVISMSLGGPGDSDDPVCVAVQNAVAAGIVVVVAAGNEGPSLGTVAAPGVAPDVITVGAIDKSNKLADFSSRGTVPELTIKPEISAPGVSIASTVPYGGTSLSSATGYLSASGTSMATPHVAGGAALLLQLHPTWTPAQVKSALVTGSYDLAEPVWSAGAGGMWLPNASSSRLFLQPALVSYGTAGDPSKTITVYNPGSALAASTSSTDWSTLLANGTMGPAVWTNVSSVSPASVTLPSSGPAALTLQVRVPPTSAPEGYYDGTLRITSGTVSISTPFGFAVLSRLTVNVRSTTGASVSDPYGGVWVYRVPECDVALGKRGTMGDPVPPVTFLVPSGNYNVHSIGHQLLYDFSDPYALSAKVTVPRLSSTSVELSMSSAKAMVLDLETEDGTPIYVKDFRVYFRYQGGRNVSFHVTGSDYSIKGAEVFTVPKAKTVYVSETDARVGISISGFSYSAGMWDFMSRNWDHWFEFASGQSTEFLVEASTDLQYLMAWEFDGVDASTPTALGLVDGQYSAYETKYDIPGSIGDLWCNWGTHRAQGGDAAFFVRRDTDTSLNPFFTGMTRRTIVQGVFSELYYPGNLFKGFLERSFYTPDYSHLVRANTASEIYLPDRNFITPLEPESVFERLGVGPFYPSLTTRNTNTTLVILQPLLRDQSGAKVGGMSMPTMELYREGQVVGYYQFPEYLARPDAERIINLTSTGQYMAKITYTPFPQISSSVLLTLGFKVPSADVNPPEIRGMSMAQAFVPGTSVPMTLTASDDRSAVSATVSWRPTDAGSWQPLAVTSLGGGEFSASIPTSSSDGAIHLLVRVTDASGNYIEFSMSNAALAQVPVAFSLSSTVTEVGYRDGDAHVVLVGELKDLSGNPLSPTGAVPLELMHDGRKIGMILDEYCTASSHAHNGSIRFDWHFNPADLFSGPSDTAHIEVVFDLGIYQRASQTITLTSTTWTNLPPAIALVSPANQSLNPAGATIRLSFNDEDPFTVQAYLDGASIGQLSSPWEVSTSSWDDGRHELMVVATDSFGSVSSAVFSFDIDASDPVVDILYPSAGSRVPVGSTFRASVSDAYLLGAAYSLDGGPAVAFPAPYTIDMTGWSVGQHTVEVSATDAVGKVSTESVTFEIAKSTVVVSVLSPANGSVSRSGIPIELSAEGAEPVSVRWNDGGAWHDLGSLRSISTSGWSEGIHDIVINATDSLNGFDEIQFTITIDDSPPQVVLVSPSNGSFVSKTDVLRMSVIDANFKSVNWTMWGLRWRSTNPELYISLASSPSDGYFSVQMVALDLAGNEFRCYFTFAMDSSPPSVYVANLVSGGALRPGVPLDVVVEDPFLTSVTCSVDSGEVQPLAPPYDIGTSALPNGHHTVEVAAADATGKSSHWAGTFYIDATLPLVAISGEPSFTEGSPHTITADATDDFAIGTVTLHLELPDGSFAPMPMGWDGTHYVAVIPQSALWDGMSVYAVAVDEAGNLAGTPRVQLHAVSPIPGTDAGSDSPNLGPGILSSSGFAQMALIGSIVAVLLVGIVLALRSRREGSHAEAAPARNIDSQVKCDDRAISTRTPEPKAAPMASRTSAGGRGDRSEAMLRKQDEERQSRQALAVPKAEQKPRAVPLIEAIPEMPPVSSTDADGGADEVDYGELIERELILPGREGSVYKGQEDEPPRTDFEVLRKIADDLGRLGPRKPPF